VSLPDLRLFQKVTLSFLPVGHTHEDIDAIFGVLMRYLTKLGAITTIQAMMDVIWKCMSNSKKSSWQPNAKMERLRATYNWSDWLKEACGEAETLNKANGRPDGTCPLRGFSHFALTTGKKACADNRRPHKFEFCLAGSGDQRHVVMHYYHWCHDTEVWTGSKPIVMFNYVPNPEWLKPAKLRPSTLAALRKCEGVCKSNSDCPKCGVFSAFKSKGDQCVFQADTVFTMEDIDEWEEVFASTTSVDAHSTLPAITPLPKAEGAKRQSSQFHIPLACQHPGKDTLQPPIHHSPDDVALDKMLNTVRLNKACRAKFVKTSGQDASANQGTKATVRSNTTAATASDTTGETAWRVSKVVGARRDASSGEVEVAIIWQENGTWEPICNMGRLEEDAYVDDLGGNDKRGDAEALEAAEAHLRWQDNFGSELIEGHIENPHPLIVTICVCRYVIGVPLESRSKSWQA